MIWFLWRKICISISTARDWCQKFPRNWSDRLWTIFLWLFYCLKRGCVVLRKIFVYPLVSTRSVNGCKMVGVCRSTMINVSCGCDEQVCSRTYYCRPTICIVHVYILVRIISYYVYIYIYIIFIIITIIITIIINVWYHMQHTMYLNMYDTWVLGLSQSQVPPGSQNAFTVGIS